MDGAGWEQNRRCYSAHSGACPDRWSGRPTYKREVKVSNQLAVKVDGEGVISYEPALLLVEEGMSSW